jgi:dihydroflavonol-4-reductase
MKVLIAGAGGYLGEHIVHAVVEAGHAAVVCVRDAHAPRFPDGVRCVEGDLGDVEFVRQALAGVDAVVFSAGRNWQPGLAGDEYLRQNVSIVEIFFAALAKSNPAARVVFTSSMSAIAGSLESVAFTEDFGRTAVCTARLSPYDCAKVECERLARNAAAAGRRLVVLNPGLMLGPGASASSNVTTSALVQWFCLRKSPAFVGSGGHTFCDVRDVARAHVAALGKGSAGNRYIVGGENLGWTQFQRLMSEQAGIRIPIQVSARDAFIAVAVMDGLSAASFGLWKNPVHRAFARSVPLYYWGDSARAARDLDYGSRPLAQTIRDTIVDFVHRGMLPNEFRYVEAMTDDTRTALLLLKELAQNNLHRSYLVGRLSDILAACRQNHTLNEALDAVLASGHYDPKRGRFLWRGAAPTNALMKLRSLLDYCYYASDEFSERVT